MPLAPLVSLVRLEPPVFLDHLVLVEALEHRVELVLKVKEEETVRRVRGESMVQQDSKVPRERLALLVLREIEVDLGCRVDKVNLDLLDHPDHPVHLVLLEIKEQGYAPLHLLSGSIHQ